MAGAQTSKRWIVLSIFLAAIVGAGLAVFTPPPAPVEPEPAPAPESAAAEAPAPQPIAASESSVVGPRPIPRNVAATLRNGAPRMPAAPAFAEIAEDQFVAATPRYRAELSAADGLRYTPAGRDGEIHVRLQRVSRGASVLFDRNEPDVNDEQPVNDGAAISFWRAPGLEENYVPRGDGVEQTFALDVPPAGEGDLEFVLDLNIRNFLPAPPRLTRGGIAFLDNKGNFAGKYGQVVIRDSAKNSAVVEPTLAADGKTIRFAVPADFLASAEFPILVDPLVGEDFLISPDNNVFIGPPTIAAGNTSYLVVWNDYRDGANLPQLAGAIVSQSGIVSDPFPVSSAVGLPSDFRSQRISIAWDGSNWLVVWSDNRQVGFGVRGCLINSSGQAFGGSDFLISPTEGAVQEDPLVIYNGIDFIVAWQDTPPGASGGSQIYVSRVTSAGIVDTPQVLLHNIVPINQALLFMAPQKPSGDTLIVYRENMELPLQVRSTRIGINGVVRDPGGTSMFKSLAEESGFGQPIGATWVGTEWHVLSSYQQTEDSSIFLHKISTDGVVTPPTGVFAEMGLGPIGSSIDFLAPAFAGAGEWLFVRNQRVNNTVYHLVGKRVTFAGVDKDPIPFQIDTATQGVLRNSVAAQINNLFLVAWMDGRRGSAQPADGKNIAGAFVDVTIAGSTGTALKPVIAASPTSGEGPLAVAFDSTGSVGSFDTLTWDFGDGTSATTDTVSHTYRSNGTYIAQLKLTKGAYSVFETVVITVGTGGPAGGALQVGTPLENTPGLTPGLFIQAATLRLNFADDKKDALTFRGIVDVGELPDTLTGLICNVSVGSISKTFNLDAKGAFKSNANETPFYTFGVDPVQGAFVFNLINDDLRSAADSLGAKNLTVKPAITVDLPVTITLGSKSYTATVGTSYRATQDISGIGTYVFLGSGEEVTGSFVVSKFSAGELKNPRTGDKTHNYNVKGQLIRPTGGTFTPDQLGDFTFVIGNYVLRLPVGQFVNKDGKIIYRARAGTSGLKKFNMDLNSGIFTLQMTQLPAEIAGGTGLPVAKSGQNIVKVDLNLSFDFDLKDSQSLTAGRYMFISRKDAAGKAWKLR